MKKLSLLTAFLIAVISLFYSAKYRWSGDSWKTIICADGYGYYSYLPCIFILHHFDYKTILADEKKMNPLLHDELGDLSLSYQGKKYNKYFAGVAVLLLPFFLLAYFISHLSGFETDGYSMLFQGSVTIGAIFYLLIGLLFIRKLLKEYAISEGIIALVLVLIVFGTNLFYYATFEPSMSHVYTFGLAAIFLFYVKKAITGPQLKYLLWITVSMSLMVIIRPTNLLLIAFIPFLAGDFTALKKFSGIFSNLKYLMLCLAVGIAIISIQFILWYVQIGRFIIWSYQGEGFDFGNPHFIDILFSYQNGWFIYTPLMLFSIAGFILLFRKKHYLIASILLFFIVITYVFSSWWCWYFGGYGLRAFVDFYPAYALPIAMLLNRLKPLWLKLAALIIGVLCIMLNLVQTIQFQRGILLYCNMTKEMYWAIFLKTSNRYSGMVSMPLPEDINFSDSASFANDFEHNTWGSDNTITNAHAHSGKFSAIVDDKQNYSPTLFVKCGALPQQPHLYAYIDLWMFLTSLRSDSRLVVSIESADRNAYYYTADLLKRRLDDTNTWQEQDFMYELPAFKNKEDILKVYVFGTKGTAYIDDFRVKFGVLKEGK